METGLLHKLAFVAILLGVSLKVALTTLSF